METCPLCVSDGEQVLWREALLRVILACDPDYPGLCRVIVNRHVREMSDLAAADRVRVMHAVFAVESVLRELLAPVKVNLASLGNQVPHLHWHVIPRFSDDKHFPDAVWGLARRAGTPRAVDVARLARMLGERLA